MTYEEAKALLEVYIEAFGDNVLVDKAIDKGIEALEKQIPKKCRHNLPDLGHKYKYCPFCGQRLDRSDEE